MFILKQTVSFSVSDAQVSGELPGVGVVVRLS